MGVTLAIVVMGWRLYGPPAAQVKSIALRVVEQAADWLRPEAGNKGQAADKANLPQSEPPLQQQVSPLAAASPPLFDKLTPQETPAGGLSVLTPGPLAEKAPPAEVESPASSSPAERRIQTLLARLTALDVQDPQLVPWGGSGQLFRCHCRASWGQSPQFSRIFESVAPEPETAVEQVVAQIDAWRAGERRAR
jgi:hypothetical protein